MVSLPAVSHATSLPTAPILVAKHPNEQVMFSPIPKPVGAGPPPTRAPPAHPEAVGDGSSCAAKELMAGLLRSPA